jgi:type IV pilus biogenesis protein CpaD/CtpE
MLVGNMKKILICAAMLLAAGCAKRPEDIVATPVAVDPYMQMECAQLAQLKMQKDAELAKLEKDQKETADQDAAAMAVVHVPIGSMSGNDNEAGVARAKGEVQAINQAYQSKSCSAG